MLLEKFPFVILNNAMAFVYIHIFSLTFCVFLSLLLLTVTLWGVSNKNAYCLFFSSPEPKAQRRAYSIPVEPSSVCVSVCL